MTTERIHRTTSADGTQIVGRVHGQGPPLVLVPGGPGDGEVSFRSLVPALAGDLTCHAMSNRGKGLSAGHPDHSQERLVEDVVAYVDSLDGPVAVFGQSSGAVLALEAAARTAAVSALALYEPAAFDVLTDAQMAQFGDILARIRQAHDDGRAVDAVRIFYEEVARANDDERAALATDDTYRLAAPNMGSVLDQVERSGPPHLSDPSLPGRVAVPTLVMRGDRTAPLFRDAAQDLGGRLPNARLVDVPGAGHLGPQMAAGAVAEEVATFLVTVGAAA